jgi:hypothetical protein
MWNYEKRLQYPVKITQTNPKIAQVIISQFGGPDGELAASMRYLSQRYSMPYKEVTGILTDIGREASEMVFSEASAFLAILGPHNAFCCRKTPLVRQHSQINIYVVFIVDYHCVEYLSVVFVLVPDTVNQLVNGVLYIRH